MRIPFFSKKQKQKKPLTNRQRKQRAMIAVAIRWISIFMGVVIGGYIIISAIVGSSLFVPNSAEGVIESIKEPNAYTWSSESVREVEFGGNKIRQDAARGVVLNIAENKYQGTIAGVLPSKTVLASDGNIAVSLGETDERLQLFTNYCEGEEAPPASLLSMPSSDDFKDTKAKIITDEATVFGDRNWQLSFEANPSIINKLLWYNFFEKSFENNPDALEWVISKEEAEKIAAGEFTTEDASLFVNRKERNISQIDVTIKIEDGSKWRFLAQKVNTVDEAVLDEMNFGDQACTKKDWIKALEKYYDE